MLPKGTWKILMLSDPKWYIIGRASGSKEAEEAADEYDEEVGPALGILGLIIIVGGAVALLLHVLGVF